MSDFVLQRQEHLPRRTTGHMSESLQSIKKKYRESGFIQMWIPEADSTDCAGKRVQCKEILTDLTLNAGEYVGIKMTALTSASAITAEGTGWIS